METDAAAVDDLCSRASQRTAVRQDLAGLLLAAERTKPLPALAHVEPVLGAQRPAAPRLEWVLSASTRAVTARRLALVAGLVGPAATPPAPGPARLAVRRPPPPPR